MQGKTAIVTGASKGIGLAVMAMLAGEGVNVAAVSKTPGDLAAAVSSQTGAAGSRIVAIPADVAAEQDAIRVVREAVRLLGHVDYLINCAGVSQKENCRLPEIEKAEFERIMRTNVNSALYMTREFLKAAEQGYIIQILSTAAYESGAGGIMYSASKYAARAITEGLAKDLKGTKIRITSISPGPVNTNIWLHKAVPVPAEKKEKMLKPQDIADIIRFLLKTDENVHIHDIKVEPWFYLKSR